MGYTHIDEKERRRIERALQAGKSFRNIAQALDRSVSNVSEEVARGGGRDTYRADHAQAKAVRTRKNAKLQCLKVAMDPALKKFVTEEIEDGQSPEAVAGRLKHVRTDLIYASTKAIYKFVHSPHGRKIEKHLYSKAVKRNGGSPRGTRKVSIDGRVMIDKRPKHIETREEFGHFEGDFIESGKEGLGSLLVLVERKTRYPFLVYTEDKTTSHINALIGETLKDVPVKSITLDNDISFQKHNEMSELVGAIIFFCNPYHSWEKGTVENRNRCVRRYVPKKTDLSSVSGERFTEIETTLRTRYMACLNFKTPQEAWDDAKKQLENRTKTSTLTAISAPIIQINRCSA